MRGGLLLSQRLEALKKAVCFLYSFFKKKICISKDLQPATYMIYADFNNFLIYSASFIGKVQGNIDQPLTSKPTALLSFQRTEWRVSQHEFCALYDDVSSGIA